MAFQLPPIITPPERRKDTTNLGLLMALGDTISQIGRQYKEHQERVLGRSKAKKGAQSLAQMFTELKGTEPALEEALYKDPSEASRLILGLTGQQTKESIADQTNKARIKATIFKLQAQQNAERIFGAQIGKQLTNDGEGYDTEAQAQSVMMAYMGDAAKRGYRLSVQSLNEPGPFGFDIFGTTKYTVKAESIGGQPQPKPQQPKAQALSVSPATQTILDAIKGLK